jgi:hypothetical protein
MDRRCARVVERWLNPSYWVLRVVLCRPGQKGWLSERAVVKLWESESYTYHGWRPGSKYQRLLAEARRVADEANRNFEAGLKWDTPAGIRSDFLLERGVA